MALGARPLRRCHRENCSIPGSPNFALFRPYTYFSFTRLGRFVQTQTALRFRRSSQRPEAAPICSSTTSVHISPVTPPLQSSVRAPSEGSTTDSLFGLLFPSLVRTTFLTPYSRSLRYLRLLQSGSPRPVRSPRQRLPILTAERPALQNSIRR